MKVCLVSRELYPFQKAGIAVYIDNMAKEFSKNGHQVFIITTEENAEHRDVQYATLIGSGASSYTEIFSEYSMAYSYSVYLKLLHLCKEEEIDVVEFSDYFGEGFFTLLNRNEEVFRNTKFVLKLHTPTYECNEINGVADVESLLTEQEDFCISNCPNVYAISKAMKNRIESRLKLNDIPVVYNLMGENTMMTKPDKIIELDEKIVLFVGRLEKRKGIDLLVEACIDLISERIPFKCIIIGQNLPYNNTLTWRAYLDSLIPHSFRDKFIFLDPISKEELNYYYSIAHVSVFPSVWEGFGNVCVEAMTMGSPILVSDSSGMMDIIGSNEFGLSFDVGNKKDLLEKLKLLLTDDKVHSEYAQKALQRSGFFSNEVLFDKQIQYYESAIFESDSKKYDINSMSIIKKVIENLIKDAYKIRLGRDELYKECSKLLDYSKNLEDRMKVIEETLALNSKKLTDEIDRIMDEYTKNYSLATQEILRITDEWEKEVELRNQIEDTLNKMIIQFNDSEKNYKAEIENLNERLTEANRVYLKYKSSRGVKRIILKQYFD